MFGPESSRLQAFGSFVIHLSSLVRGQYCEAVFSKCLRLAAALPVLCWLFCRGALGCYSAAMQINSDIKQTARKRGLGALVAALLGGD